MAVGKLIALLVVVVFILSAPTIRAVDSGSKGEVPLEWQLLSASNFSSQIRLNPYVLLFVTLPWCGESRSVMKGLSQKLATQQEKYGSLKLMLVHLDRDKVLANSLNATEGITILCYRHAVPYRYQGSLRVQDILSSVDYLISLAPEEFPLKRLNNSNDLETFLASTDKAVLLLESCGWIPKFVAQRNDNEAEQGGVLPGDLNFEINGTLGSAVQKNLKDLGNEVNYEVDDGYGSFRVGEFSGQNGTALYEDMQPTFKMPCSFEEYKKFKSFFLKFMTVARGHYLPPQRQKYALVSDKLLLKPLGIEVSDRWSLIISYAGCPGCSTTLKEENYLQDVLKMHDLPVMELEDKGKDVGPTLPVNKPSILLFADRTSDSIEIRRKSQEALNAFKEVALQYWKPYQVDEQHSDWPTKSSILTYEKSANMYENHRLLLSPSSQKIKLKDKMSIMVINDGKRITLDNVEGSSLHEILTHVLGQKKPSKLSSLAKEAGFHLLSDDVDMKIVNVLSSETENQNQYSAKQVHEVARESPLDMNTYQAETLVEHEKQSQHITLEAPDDDNEQKATSAVPNKDSALADPDQYSNGHGIAFAVDVDPEMQTHIPADQSEGLKLPFSGFSGSFFSSDGNYQLLRSLTNDSEVPRIVIVDPISQQHYIFSEVANISFSSISAFIEKFLNGSLSPYIRSGPFRNSVEMPRPPLVNLDFHEKVSIPCVTSETFSELVLGSSQANGQNATDAWHNDVLVLFSSSWCGFCQRMEIVVREVYRALKGYMDILKCDSKSTELFSRDDFKDVTIKLPAIYSIDCTLNECGWMLKSMGQKEVYPTLLLFPAERKTAIPYDGNMMVTDVLKFLASHGTRSHHLYRHKGTLWTDIGEREKHVNKVNATLMSVVGKKSNGKSQNLVMSKLKQKAAPPNVAVGSFLTATEYFHGSNPFNKARILIVGADCRVGVQGLIVNNPLSWDSVPELEYVELLREAHIFFGGPIIQEDMPLVSLTKISFNKLYPQVVPGVYFLDQLATMDQIEKVKAGKQSATDYWFFWGYAGWHCNQLQSEIAQGVWSLSENIEDLWWSQ